MSNWNYKRQQPTRKPLSPPKYYTLCAKPTCKKGLYEYELHTFKYKGKDIIVCERCLMQEIFG